MIEMDPNSEKDNVEITCKVILHSLDVEDFKEELKEWLMNHRMGMENVRIDEERRTFTVHGREYDWTRAEMVEQMGFEAMPDDARDLWDSAKYPIPPEVVNAPPHRMR